MVLICKISEIFVFFLEFLLCQISLGVHNQIYVFFMDMVQKERTFKFNLISNQRYIILYCFWDVVCIYVEFFFVKKLFT